MDRVKDMDIAIVGMACRFPGAVASPEEFWNFLMRGGDGIVDVPADRWDSAAYFDADKEKPNRMYVRRGGFIADIDQFDPMFFGIAPKEAHQMDPQHRWLLELTFEAFENAGLKLSDLKGSDTAVYVGQFMHDYEQLQLDALAHHLIGSYSATGPSMTLTANRISYAFDLTGASVALDTACSSSLVALDLACKAILNGDSRIAVAAGANILLRPELTMSICKASMLSPDGRCKSFDAAANGYVRSEGAGVVVLKRLADAVRAGDRVLAVIKASGVNQDGQTNGITVPNGAAQKNLLERSLQRAGFAPEEIQYAEAHGTGTAVGDPIEVNALGALLGARDADVPQCVIGSVKSNIGHMEATAGLAGLMKTVLAMNAGLIPKNIHYHQTNPAIDLARLNIRIAAEHVPWPDVPGRSRKAIVNSFGFGGTNANAVLELPPPADANHGRDQAPVVNGAVKLLPLSARSEDALKALAKKYGDWLQGMADAGAPAATRASLHDMCWMAATRREHFQHRLVVVGRDHVEMAQALAQFAQGRPVTNIVSALAERDHTRGICFVFSGMGTQWAGMGRALYDTEPVFKDMLERCDRELRRYASWSLLDAILNEGDPEKINETYLAQPAIFAIQVSLAELLKSWGIVPGAVVGHSAGEVGAAYVAGVYSFEDAVRIIHHRSRLQHTTEGMGTMLAVGLSESALAPYLSGHGERISIAAINTEQDLTLSGEQPALAALAAQLEGQGIFACFLKVGVPYHSPVMDSLRTPMIEALQGVQVRAPHTPLYSTVSGTLTRQGDWGAEYWPDNVRKPVLFKAAIEQAVDDGLRVFLEIAPNAALTSSVQKNVKARRQNGVYVTTLKRDQDALANVMQAVGALHAAGVPIDWQRLYPNGGAWVRLPNYAWQRASYWCEADEVRHARLKNVSRRSGMQEPVHPLLGSALNSTARIWQQSIDLQELSYLDGHRVQNEVVYPGAAYVEMALKIAGLNLGGNVATLEDIRFKRALFLDAKKPTAIESRFDADSGAYEINAVDANTGQWVGVSAGIVSALPRASAAARIDLPALIGRLQSRYEKDSFYQHCAGLGLDYHGEFRPVSRAWHQGGEAVVEIDVSESVVAALPQYWLHPAILDGAFQSLFATIERGYLPVKIGTLAYYRKPGAKSYCHLSTKFKDEFEIKGDLTIVDADGEVLVAIRGVELKTINAAAADAADSLLYDYRWQPEPLTGAAGPAAGKWLIFADETGVGRQLAEELQRRSQTVCLIRRGESFQRLDEQRFIVPSDEDALHRFIKTFDHACRGVIYLWGLDAPGGSDGSAAAALDSCNLTAVTPLHVAKALAGVEWKQALRVCWISRSAHGIDPQSLPQPAQAALWGFGRVFAAEHSEFAVSLIDIVDPPVEQQIKQLADEVLSGGHEQEIALRAGGRFVHRLQRLTPALLERHAHVEAPLRDGEAFAVALRSRAAGQGELQLQSILLTPPAPDQVEIRLEYVAITARALQAAVASDAAKPQPLAAYECVGVVTRVGGTVTSVAGGDRVVALVGGRLASVVQVPAAAIATVPAGVNAAQAATASAAFATAHHCLTGLARLQDGESVLIHEAADGIGMAALQIARLKNATIYTTAGTPEKRAALTSLGVHVFDSSSFEFIEEISSLSRTRGVDVALNVLPGQFAARTLGLMSEFGRFVELGNGAGIKSAAVQELIVERSLSYHVLDPTRWLGRQAAAGGELLRLVMELLANARVAPPAAQVFAVDEIEEARQRLAEGSDLTRVLLDFNITRPLVAQALQDRCVHAHGTYLVTGGLGGLGLELMDWLADQGARSIVLIGRSAPARDSRERIAAVQSRGVTLATMQADVTDAGDVARVLEAIANDMLPLAGVIHAAGVLEDGLIAQQTAARFHKVLAPKIKGAWNLHQLTEGLDLDFFVLFSSIAAVVGWAGQSNYAAANAFMDALAHQRRACGKPGLSINWGPWRGAGMAAKLEARDLQRMSDAGMTPLSSAQGFAAMSSLLIHRVPQAGVFALDWSRIFKQYTDPLAKTVFADFVPHLEIAGEADFVEQLRAAVADSRASMLADQLGVILAGLLDIQDAALIDKNKSVFEYGINSLLSMDFVVRVQATLKTHVSSTMVLKHPTLNAMSNYLLEEVLGEALEKLATNTELLLWDPKSATIDFAHERNGPLLATSKVVHWQLQGKSAYWNVGFLLQWVAPMFSLDALKTTMRILLSFHDGCRLRIKRDASGGYTQEIFPSEGQLSLEEHDFTGLGYEQGAARMAENNARLHRSMEFSYQRPLFRMAYYQLDGDSPHRFFLIFHHYVLDGWSLKIFITDFIATYMRVFRSERVSFPSKGTPLSEWTARLNAFANGAALEQLPYWKAQVDKARHSRLMRELRTHRQRRLDDTALHEVLLPDERYERLQDFCRARGIDLTDLAIYAVAHALSRHTHSNSLWVDLMLHARTGIFSDFEIPGAVGMISETGSMLFTLDPTLPRVAQLQAIHRQRSEVPNGGLGIKALKYLNKDPSVRELFSIDDLPQVVINITDTVLDVDQAKGWGSLAPEGIGASQQTVVQEDHASELVVFGIRRSHGLGLVFEYFKDFFYPDTVSAIADEVQSIMLGMLEPEAVVTPAVAHSPDEKDERSAGVSRVATNLDGAGRRNQQRHS